MPDESVRARLEQIVDLLEKHGVAFMIVGGQAESLMGGSRLTYDNDLAYSRTPPNLEKLAAALRELGVSLRNAPADLPFQLDAQALALGNNFTLDTPFGPLDLLGWLDPIGDYEALLPGSELHDLGNGLVVRTIGLDDLIHIKQHIRRDKDRESLRQLLAIRVMRREEREESSD